MDAARDLPTSKLFIIVLNIGLIGIEVILSLLPVLIYPVKIFAMI